MGFFKFYGLVFREGFRHSLDIAQAIVFVLLILGGVIVARNPASKSIIDTLDLGGWEVGCIVLITIISVRLILAPYWLWKAAQARLLDHQEATIDFGLRVESFHHDFNKQKKGISTNFILKNGLSVAIQYEGEDVLVTIEGIGLENPTFDNMGGIISRYGTHNFAYPWIYGVPIKPGTEGYASITYKYGIAGKPFARRARYVAKLYSPGIKGGRSNVLEESEEGVG